MYFHTQNYAMNLKPLMNVGLATLRSGMIIGSKHLRMNTIRTLISAFAFTVFALSTAAQLQNNQWRFGFNSAIDFNTNPISFPTGTALPTIDPPLITGNQIEGTASIADRNTGELLFYTDGVTIWNALNQPMPNGSDLGGSDVLSSYMAAVIVPIPGGCNSTKYYVFCIDDYEEGSDGITYSVVDMSLDNGLGDVVAGQKSIPLYDNETEVLLAYPKSSGDGYWIISNGSDPNVPTLAAFEVTALGVNPVPVISPVNVNGSGKLNYLGNRFACQSVFDNSIGEFLGFTLYDFDASTGEFSNPVNINFLVPGDVLQYFEFTFDDHYLYAGANNSFYQLDLSSGDPASIAASGALIPFTNTTGAYGVAQMGPDGNLYQVIGGTLYRIENPNNPAASIGPISALPAEVAPFYALPQWIHVLGESGSDETIIDLAVNACEPYTLPDGTTTNIPGVYSYTLITQGGCDSIVNLTLSFTQPPQITITQNALGCGAQSEVEITATGNSTYTYSIPEVSIENSTGIFTLSSGTYTATVSDTENCTVTESLVVTGTGSCPQDFDLDLIVGVSDLQLFNAAYGCVGDCCPYDLNSDGAVSVADLLNFITAFGVLCD
jgi:hypothetical protein